MTQITSHNICLVKIATKKWQKNVCPYTQWLLLSLTANYLHAEQAGEPSHPETKVKIWPSPICHQFIFLTQIRPEWTYRAVLVTGVCWVQIQINWISASLDSIGSSARSIGRMLALSPWRWISAELERGPHSYCLAVLAILWTPPMLTLGNTYTNIEH